MSSAAYAVVPKTVGWWRRAQDSRSNLWGFMDQALVSGTNFLVTVVLARGLGPSAFGTFTLAFTAILFANSVQSALVTQPHNVLSHEFMERNDYQAFNSSLAMIQAAVSLLAVVVAVIGGMVGAALGHQAVGLVLSVILVIPCWQVQEYLRRILYSESRLRAAFVSDLIAYGGQTICAIAICQRGSLTIVTALLNIAAFTCLSAIVTGARLRDRFRGGTSRELVSQALSFGKWLLASQVGYWISTQSYVYVVAWLLGAASTGLLRSALTIMGPLMFLLQSLDSILLPGFSRIYTRSGIEGLRHRIRSTYLQSSVLILAYCVLVLLFNKQLVRFLYGPDYPAMTRLFAWLSLFFVVGHALRIYSAGLRATRSSRAVFSGYGWACLFTVTFGVLLVQAFDVPGAVLGMTLSAAVTLVVIMRALYQHETA